MPISVAVSCGLTVWCSVWPWTSSAPHLWASTKSLLALESLDPATQTLVCQGGVFRHSIYESRLCEFIITYCGCGFGWNIVPGLLGHSLPGLHLQTWLIPHTAEALSSRECKGYGPHPPMLDSSHCQPEMRTKPMLPQAYQHLPITGQQLLSRTTKCHGSVWQKNGQQNQPQALLGVHGMKP